LNVPLTGSGLLFDLLGLPLLIVSMIIFVRFVVLTPVITLERANIRDAFERSLELTKGKGWRIFGVFVIAFTPVVAALVLAFAVIGLSPTAAAADFDGLRTWLRLLGVLSSVLGAIVAVVLYLELKRTEAVAAEN
jgi:hypothetical protein